MKKLLYLVAEDSYFYSHRLELASFIKQQGYEVAVATKCSKNNLQYKEAINNQDLKLFELKFFCRTSYINPFKEFLALKELYYIYKTFKPDIVHHVALKPIIYGTIIAQIVKVKRIINALAGLGFVFTEANYNTWFKNIKLKIKQKFLQIIISKILKIIFNNNNNNKILLLQNQDDLAKLKQFLDITKLNLVTAIIPGSGIVEDRYFTVQPLNFTNDTRNIKIVLVARLLWTKGIAEFVNAAKYIKNYIKQNNLLINPEFILYGDIDPKNPASVDYATINQWQNQGLIIWKNFCHNIIEAYASCHIAVLPSYREGLPKSLLEAALCARAIVTTDVPGCREIVEHGVNGYLVPKQDSEALAKALLALMQDQNLIVNMGILGREKIYNKFSAKTIFPQMLDLYAN
jgi:glycosyltransferase involved in cell wall biosynthesis